jgi:hypothetical protein
MAMSSDNYDRLQEAGIVRMGREECPNEYVEVIDRLTDEQVDVLLEVFERLEKVGPEAAAELRPDEQPRWITCMWF